MLLGCGDGIRASLLAFQKTEYTLQVVAAEKMGIGHGLRDERGIGISLPVGFLDGADGGPDAVGCEERVLVAV